MIRIADPREFYDGDFAAHYGASWMLVHYALHGDEGRYASGFVEYLRREREGAGGPEAFYEATGLDPRELDPALAAHVKTVKVR